VVFDFTPNSFLKSLSACLKDCMVSFISRNCADRYESLSFIRWCSTARTDMATTREAPRRNRQTDAATARTGTRMLTALVRLWGTIRMVTGVRSRLRNILGRFKPVSSMTYRRGSRNRHSKGRGEDNRLISKASIIRRGTLRFHFTYPCRIR